MALGDRDSCSPLRKNLSFHGEWVLKYHESQGVDVAGPLGDVGKERLSLG